MQTVGRVESLWRYPVKSMRGEQLETAYARFSGLEGDRIYAIHDAAARADFPYLTAREREQMLLFHPVFRDPDSQHDPGSALRPALDVHTPEGSFSIDDPALLRLLSQGLAKRHALSLIASQRAMTDAHPISLFSIQTAWQLAQETGAAIDKRRFRANIYLDLQPPEGFAEDRFVGHRLRIGDTVVLAILDRDPRCKIITLDPDTAAAQPEIIKRVARSHESRAGIYAAVLVEGAVRSGDPVVLLS